MSIFNPWGELKDAERTIAAQGNRIEDLYKDLSIEREARATDKKEYDLGRRLLRSEIERLEALLKQAHFRHPKTGRIGKKGERF